MFKKMMIGAAVGAFTLVSAVVAQAATLSVVGGETQALPGGSSGFSLGSIPGVGVGTNVQVYDGDLSTTAPNTNGSNGLQLIGAPATLRFQYLGSEAGDHNQLIVNGTVRFDNQSGPNSDFDLSVGPPANQPVDFTYRNNDRVVGGFFCFLFGTCSTPTDADNTGGIDWPLSLALFQESSTSVIALFGDGAGDADFDDMAIRISVVPLPPALLLFGGALFGLGWLSRRRKAAA